MLPRLAEQRRNAEGGESERTDQQRVAHQLRRRVAHGQPLVGDAIQREERAGCQLQQVAQEQVAGGEVLGVRHRS